MYLDKEKTPYELGYAAGRSGKAVWACPYDCFQLSQAQHYREWMRGHANGFRDRKLAGVYSGYEEY